MVKPNMDIDNSDRWKTGVFGTYVRETNTITLSYVCVEHKIYSVLVHERLHHLQYEIMGMVRNDTGDISFYLSGLHLTIKELEDYTGLATSVIMGKVPVKGLVEPEVYDKDYYYNMDVINKMVSLYFSVSWK